MRKYFISLLVLLFIFPALSQEEIVIENDTPTQIHEPSRPDFLTSIRTGLGNISSGINGDSALLLISGGLFILLFVVPLAMINSMFWKRGEAAHHKLRGLKAPANIGGRYDLGFSTGSSLKPQSVDDIIDTLKYLEDVDVKIVNSTTTYKRIRIKGCRACEGKNSKKPVCEFERGFLAGAFGNLHKSAEVKETKCRAEGYDFCEFDIQIKR